MDFADENEEEVEMITIINEDADQGTSQSSEKEYLITAQLENAGVEGVAAAAAVMSARKKKHLKYSFEGNPTKRMRHQNRLMRILLRALNELSTRVGKQAALVIANVGKSRMNLCQVFGAQPLRDIIRDNGDMIVENLEKVIANQCPIHPIAANVTDLPPLVFGGIPTPVSRMSQTQLRSFIPLMLKYSLGRGKPGWGRKHLRPSWWPSDVPWSNIRTDRRDEIEKKKVLWTRALKQVVINCYHFHSRQDLLPAFNEEDVRMNSTVVSSLSPEDETTELEEHHDEEDDSEESYPEGGTDDTVKYENLSQESKIEYYLDDEDQFEEDIDDSVETEESIEDSVQTEDIEDSVQTEDIEDSVQTEDIEDSVQTEDIEDSVQTEDIEDSVQTEDIEDSVQTEEDMEDSVQTEEDMDVTDHTDENIEDSIQTEENIDELVQTQEHMGFGVQTEDLAHEKHIREVKDGAVQSKDLTEENQIEFYLDNANNAVQTVQNMYVPVPLAGESQIKYFVDAVQSEEYMDHEEQCRALFEENQIEYYEDSTDQSEETLYNAALNEYLSKENRKIYNMDGAIQSTEGLTFYYEENLAGSSHPYQWCDSTQSDETIKMSSYQSEEYGDGINPLIHDFMAGRLYLRPVTAEDEDEELSFVLDLPQGEENSLEALEEKSREK